MTAPLLLTDARCRACSGVGYVLARSGPGIQFRALRCPCGVAIDVPLGLLPASGPAIPATERPSTETKSA